MKSPDTAYKDKEVVAELKHVQKSFNDHVVLKDVNLNLNRGENLVVLGRSGTGKSVLIKCIVRLIEADSGSIRIFGKDISDLKVKELNKVRSKIGFLFQSGALYDSMTVRENLEFPIRRKMRGMTREEIDNLVMEVLESVGLKNAINKMPAELSGGQRKRISLARTLILKPDLILYDEPTTGLDAITSEEISELILQIQKKYKTSSIIITHDLKCARIVANRIMIIDGGEFIAEGSYEDLASSDDDKINAYFK
jgi:phospholipid/cholesterol/gamma-HCH transport system ATP-binding protein